MATKKKRGPKKKTGRKPLDGAKPYRILKKLRAAWSIGASDEEACSYAEISTTTYYKMQEANPELKELKERLKEKPTLLARQNVVNAIKVEKDKHISFDYLKRKKKREFSERTEHEVSGNFTDWAKEALAEQRKEKEAQEQKTIDNERENTSAGIPAK